MATGYRYKGDDLENILEVSRNTNTENITNFDTTKFKQGPGLLPLNNFISRNYDYDHIIDTISLSNEFIQTPTLEKLVLKGGRPRFVDYTWSLEKYGNSRNYEGYFLSKGVVPNWASNYGFTPGEYLVITHRSKHGYLFYKDENDIIEQTLYSKDDLGLNYIPKLIFFSLSAGGGGGGGGGNSVQRGIGGGGGGGGAVCYGYLPIKETNFINGNTPFEEPTYYGRDDLLSPGVLVGKGGKGGDSGSYGSDGSNGNQSWVGIDGFSVSLDFGNGGERGGQNGGVGGTGGHFSTGVSEFFILGGTDGGDGGNDNGYDGGSINNSISIENENVTLNTSGGEGWRGGGGGASKGNGADGVTNSGSADSGNKGSGGGGGRNASIFVFITKTDGGDGGDGAVTFFY